MLRDGTSTPQADATDIAAASAASVGRTSDKISQAMLSAQPLSKESELEVQKAEKVTGRHVCGLVNEALTALNLGDPPVYSEDAQALLRQAWAIAALLRSHSVSPFHMIAALAAARQKWADQLSVIVKAEPAWLLAGALVRPAVLDTAAGVQPLGRIAPHPALLEWIAEAGAHAVRKRPSASDILPDDMIAVLGSREANSSVTRKIKRLLLQAARVGRTPAELVKARQGVDNVGMTLGFFKTATDRRLNDVDQNLDTVAKALRALPDRVALDQALDGMTAAVRDGGAAHRTDLETVATRLSAIDDRLTQLPSNTANVDLGPMTDALGLVDKGIRGALGGTEARQRDLLVKIERQASAIEKKLQSAPPVGWLALSVLTVLALGIAAGLWLTPG